MMTGTLKSPEIPPESIVSAGLYEYNPCPIESPPMDSDTFMHYFYSPSCAYDESLWATRLPKRVDDALTDSNETLPQGWGIRIEERPHWRMFTFLMIVILLISALVAGLYSWKTGDNQTGVAIGAWLTTTQAAGLVGLFFWWH
jgi:hypothetical protein